MKILGIETSCDETAAAVVENGYYMKSNVVASSLKLHAKYGGVIPEIAARSHIEVILPVIEQALDEAKCTWSDIDAIGVTYGPGLGGSLLVGVLTARTLSMTQQKPLYGVNHVAAHFYANFITKSDIEGYRLPDSAPEFPCLALIVSGGHTLLVLFKSHFDYLVLGQTKDDAVGEAFDKVAKILGLPYPGGPELEKLAKTGDPNAYDLPTPKMLGYDFSYSGLKTAVLRAAQAEIGESYDFPSIKLPERLKMAQKANLAASFQRVAFDMLINKTRQAWAEYKPKSIAIAGGVSASLALHDLAIKKLPETLYVPDLKLCTDNAVMVATISHFMSINRCEMADFRTLDVDPNLSL